MTRRSESPYSRHGATDATLEQRKRLFRLTGRETVWYVAHATIGEWRLWRNVTEENEISDPFNLRGLIEYADDLETVVEIEVDAEDGTTEPVNFSEDLGRYFDLGYRTPELEGDGYLQITDLEGGTYTTGEDFGIAFKAPGEDSFGDVAAFSITDLQDPGGSADTVQHGVTVTSASGAYTVTVLFDLDVWLVWWLLRDVPITFDAATSWREDLIVPTLELPTGRGEA